MSALPSSDGARENCQGAATARAPAAAPTIITPTTTSGSRGVRHKRAPPQMPEMPESHLMLFRTASVSLAHESERGSRSLLRDRTLAVQETMIGTQEG